MGLFFSALAISVSAFILFKLNDNKNAIVTLVFVFICVIFYSVIEFFFENFGKWAMAIILLIVAVYLDLKKR